MDSAERSDRPKRFARLAPRRVGAGDLTIDWHGTAAHGTWQRQRKGTGMNITTTFRQMHGTDAVRSYAETKVSKLQKFLRQAIRANVTLTVEGNEHIAEVHVRSGGTHLHGSEKSEDMYASIDLVIDKLESQIRTVNGTRVSRKRAAMKPGELLARAVDRAR